MFYTAQEFENDVIVTADDDALYPENWLEGLWDIHEKYPGCVCCYRAHEITFEGGRVAPYQEWYGLSPDKKDLRKHFSRWALEGVVSCRLFQRHRVRQREDYEAVPDGGRYVAQDRGSAERISAVKVSTNSKEWFTIRNSQRQCLMSVNTAGRMRNDEALQNLMEYYHVTAEMLGGTSTEQKGKG